MIKYRYRSIWVADVPLDTFDTRLDPLLELLRSSRSDRLYVIGDLIDAGRLRHKWFWSERPDTLIQKFLCRQRKHAVVTYVTGTHDVFCRSPIDCKAGQVRVTREAVHHAADGRSYLVVNGPEDNAALRSAELKGVDGVICGDWVRGCLALVEDQTGKFSLIHSSDVAAAARSRAPIRQAEVQSVTA